MAVEVSIFFSFLVLSASLSSSVTNGEVLPGTTEMSLVTIFSLSLPNIFLFGGFSSLLSVSVESSTRLRLK